MTAGAGSLDLKGLAEQVQEMMSAVQQLAEVTRLLSDSIRRAPVHMDVQHLQIERVEFNLDGIDVQELGGELNIGITAMHKVRGEATDGAGAGGAAGSPPAPHPIWPPQQKGVEANGQAATAREESSGQGGTSG